MQVNTNLRFTRNSPLRSVIVDDGTGIPLYKLETPRRQINRTTHIWKFSPTDDINVEALLASKCDCSDSVKSNAKRNSGTSSDSPTIPPAKEEDVESEAGRDDIQIEFDELDGEADNEIARIHWRLFSPTRVVFAGQIANKTKLLEKTGTQVPTFVIMDP